MTDEKERGLVVYQSRDGNEIRLSFDIVRKFLVSGKPSLVTEQEMMLYMGMAKARGLNPFKRDCYLIKYTENDPAATVVSIDYFRSRAKAQDDCRGWQSGIIISDAEGKIEYRKGSFLADNEKLLGGWFRGKPEGWREDYEWSVSLKPYVKKTAQGAATRFWSEDNQAYMIAKVAESQGLRRLWPDEFQTLFTEDEIRDVTPEPLRIPQPKDDSNETKQPIQGSREVQSERQETQSESQDTDQSVSGQSQERTVRELPSREDASTRIRPDSLDKPNPPRTTKKQSPEEQKAAALKIIDEATDDDFLALPQTWLTNAIRGLLPSDQLDVCKAWNKRKQTNA